MPGPARRLVAPPLKGESMHTGILAVLALSGLLVAGIALDTSAADKDTLVIALDTLGGQIMDPIMDTRAPHAHYHAPIWDSLVGFDLEKGGIRSEERRVGKECIEPCRSR